MHKNSFPFPKLSKHKRNPFNMIMKSNKNIKYNTFIDKLSKM